MFDHYAATLPALAAKRPLEPIQFTTNDLVKVYFSSPQTGYAHLTFGGSSENGSAGSSGSTGTSGSSGTSGLSYASSGSAGTSGSSGNSIVSTGSINTLQYKTGSLTLGGSDDLKIDATSNPTTLTMIGNINVSNGSIAVSNGNITVNNSQVALLDDIIALSIALG
jgi:hypothetical protein